MQPNVIRALIVFIIAVIGFNLWKSVTPSAGTSTPYSNLDALPTYSTDFSTPEGAILCIEEAYRKHDLEAAVAAKDFSVEARMMLENLTAKEKSAKNVTSDDQILEKLAETLEISFRSFTEKQWPDFNGLKSYFPKHVPHSPGVVVVTEVCRFPDGGYSEQHILVAETPKGWRVLNPIDK